MKKLAFVFLLTVLSPMGWTTMVIDRFVDDTYAVLLIGSHQEEHEISRLRLPATAREGDWLRIEDGRIRIDIVATELARQRVVRNMLHLRFKHRPLSSPATTRF